MFSGGYTLFVYCSLQVLYKFNFIEINVYVVLTILMIMVISMHTRTQK